MAKNARGRTTESTENASCSASAEATAPAVHDAVDRRAEGHERFFPHPPDEPSRGSGARRASRAGGRTRASAPAETRSRRRPKMRRLSCWVAARRGDRATASSEAPGGRVGAGGSRANRRVEKRPLAASARRGWRRRRETRGGGRVPPSRGARRSATPPRPSRPSRGATSCGSPDLGSRRRADDTNVFSKIDVRWAPVFGTLRSGRTSTIAMAGLSMRLPRGSCRPHARVGQRESACASERGCGGGVPGASTSADSSQISSLRAALTTGVFRRPRIAAHRDRFRLTRPISALVRLPPSSHQGYVVDDARALASLGGGHGVSQACSSGRDAPKLLLRSRPSDPLARPLRADRASANGLVLRISRKDPGAGTRNAGVFDAGVSIVSVTRVTHAFRFRQMADYQHTRAAEDPTLAAVSGNRASARNSPRTFGLFRDSRRHTHPTRTPTRTRGAANDVTHTIDPTIAYVSVPKGHALAMPMPDGPARDPFHVAARADAALRGALPRRARTVVSRASSTAD